MPKNIYIHIPFCSSRCSYCNFSVIVSKNENIYEKYVNSLIKELNLWLEKNNDTILNSIYFWGGTPSILEPKLIWKILENFTDFIWKKTDILLEINPQNISEKNLQLWKNYWITKISIWIQTFQEKFFNFIERNIENLEEKIILAKKYFPNLSIDLIFWYPNQDLNDLKKDLKIIENLKVEHISFYALDYKPNSKIEKLKWEALDFKKIEEFYLFIFKKLEKNWFEHYETYNFAKNWNYSIHNKDFWEWKDYLWFWLSAVWNIWNNIFENTKNLKKYLEFFDEKEEKNNKKNENFEEKFLLKKEEKAPFLNQKKIETLNPKKISKNIKNNNFQKIEKMPNFDKNYLILQRGFRLISWIKKEKIEKLVDFEVFQKIKNSNFIQKKDWNFSLKQEKMMFFNDFFEEIFS